MIRQSYRCGDGTEIQMTKVCHHNWSGSPDGDTCYADNGGNCAWVADNEMVACYHTKFTGPCPNHPSACRIDGSTCVVLDKRQKVQPKPGGDPNRIYNGNSQLDEAPGIVNPPFDFNDWSKTSLVIMDMWDTHPFAPSRARVGELAGPINQFATILRQKGALIVHSPSSPSTSNVSSYYRGNYRNDKPSAAEAVARKRGQDARPVDDPIYHNAGTSTRVRESFYYIDDQSKWDDFNLIVPYDSSMPQSGPQPYRENVAIHVDENDVIIADGLDDNEGSNIAYQQLLGYTADRPNLIYCGVHTNWCVLRRHNGMRTMYRAGKSLWIVRDLTDCVSTPNEGTVHFGYTDTVVDWIGKHLLASTETSVRVGMPRFRFHGDDRTG
jgi:hypothetical protein